MEILQRYLQEGDSLYHKGTHGRTITSSSSGGNQSCHHRRSTHSGNLARRMEVLLGLSVLGSHSARQATLLVGGGGDGSGSGRAIVFDGRHSPIASFQPIGHGEQYHMPDSLYRYTRQKTSLTLSAWKWAFPLHNNSNCLVHSRCLIPSHAQGRFPCLLRFPLRQVRRAGGELQSTAVGVGRMKVWEAGSSRLLHGLA